MTEIKTDIKYIKEKQDLIYEQVKKTNGTVRKHEGKIGIINQKIKDHFFLHRRLDRLSRGQVTIIIAIANVIAVFGAVILTYWLSTG